MVLNTNIILTIHIYIRSEHILFVGFVFRKRVFSRFKRVFGDYIYFRTSNDKLNSH